MYILNNNRVPMSLLNLNLSSLYQNKLNSVLNYIYIVPKTLSQQAPPCYLFPSMTVFYISSHISDW